VPLVPNRLETKCSERYLTDLPIVLTTSQDSLMKIRTLALALLLATGAAVAADSKPAPSETIAIAHLMAVNDHEIQAADIAAQKKVSAPVAEYASMLKKEHSQNQTKALALPTAPKEGSAETPELMAQKEKASAERQVLSGKSGNEFETAYIDAMVNGHSEALSMIDTQLIPAASSEAVKAHFTTTREHVAMHLEKAKELRSK
jgi:putative membrane protein